MLGHVELRTKQRTRRHVKSGAAAKIRGKVIRSGQAKISKLNIHPTVGNKDILRLEVTMIDSKVVAIVDGVKDLQKRTLGQWIVTDKETTLGDVGKQVTFGTELDNHKSTVNRVHDAHQGDDIWVAAGQVMEFDFALLELPLPWVESNLVQSLHRIRNMGVDVDGRVDNAISADAKDTCQFQTVGQQQS